VDDFQVIFAVVDGRGDSLFGGHANWATGVIEDGFAFHGFAP
jgi:hypothetical protein